MPDGAIHSRLPYHRSLKRIFQPCFFAKRPFQYQTMPGHQVMLESSRMISVNVSTGIIHLDSVLDRL
jgi:hypothetical protein